MTECERIIEQGIIPDRFLRKEERCGFLVTEKWKKIWAIEIDLYLEFARVCKKHGLKFWADGGTLLGAVRHNGFIPWDDDLDVIMPREDYSKLLKVGQQEFKSPYFLQTPYTDPGYAFSFIKLRNSNTTCIPKVFEKSGYNHGIHIDIFPLDFICPDTFEEERNLIRVHALRMSSYMKRNSLELLDQRQRENFEKYQTDDYLNEFEMIQKIASNSNYFGSEYVANAVYPVLDADAQRWRASWYSDALVRDFEFIQIPIPIGFKMKLTAVYGNYMEFPPVEKRGNWHTDVLWDPDRTYMEYV